MKVTEQISTVGIPAETAYLIPTHCSACMEELDLNDSLSILSCPNPFCPNKLVRRAVHLCQVLDIKNFGESFFKALFKGAGVELLSSILALSEESVQGILDSYDEVKGDKSLASFEKQLRSLQGIIESKRETLTLPLYIKALSLPNVQSRADSIFSGFTSASEFYDKLHSATYKEDFTSLLGVSENSEATVIDLLGVLGTYMPDIVGYEKAGYSFYVPVKGDIELKVVCSTAVGAPFRSKPQFYAYIDEHYSDKVNITWSNSATKSCDVLIWSGADGSDALTSKVEKICRFNREGLHIPILTAQMLIDILNGVSDGYALKDTLDSFEIIDYTV